MKIKRFILCAVLFMAAASYAQDAASPSDAAAVSPDSSVAAAPDTALTDTSASIPPDTSGAALADTSAAIPPDTSTAALADKQEKTDAEPKPPALPDSLGAANAKSDTAAVLGKYYGFGAGVALGAIPLFSTWKGALLDSLNRIPVDPSFGNDIDADNTGNLSLIHIETPEEFNVFMPFHISLHSIRENSSASVGLSFFYNAKQFQAELRSPSDTINIYETMKYYSLSLEASWQMTVPPEYFSLKGSQKTFVSLALGLSPLQYITRYGDIDTANSGARMKAVADTAKKAIMPDLSANGASLSWRMGIGSLKSLANGNALEMGLYYSGAYSGYFFRDGKKIMDSDIARAVRAAGEEEENAEKEKDNPLSFLSTRIEFKVTYLIPVRRERKKSQEERQEQPVLPDDGKDEDERQDDKSPPIPQEEPEQQLHRADKSEHESEQDNPRDAESQQEEADNSNDEI